MARAIYLNHPDYTGVEHDTLFTEDAIFNQIDFENSVMEIRRQFDGSMLAFKALKIDL